MSTTAASRFVLLEHKLEPLKRRYGDSDVDALQRILSENALKGWEIVEACGDEIRMPVLIFRKLQVGAPMPEYLVKEIRGVEGQDEFQAVSQELWQMRDRGWLPVCIMDSPITKPVAVFKRSMGATKGLQIRLSIVPIDILERKIVSLVYELLDQQITHNLALQCIMHGGLNPVLVLITKDPNTNYEYLVEHSKGGMFSNQATTLGELIEGRTATGWEVCGAFEDSFFWPCVVFRRATGEVPVTPLEVVADNR